MQRVENRIRILHTSVHHNEILSVFNQQDYDVNVVIPKCKQAT